MVVAAVGNIDIGNGSDGVGGHFVEILKILGVFGAGDDFLGVALVESIDKRLIFGLGNGTNR